MTGSWTISEEHEIYDRQVELLFRITSIPLLGLILKCPSGTNTLPENTVSTPDVAQPSIVGRQCTVTLTWSYRELKSYGRTASKRSISAEGVNRPHRVSPPIFRRTYMQDRTPADPIAEPGPIPKEPDV